jgi:hypothetical protein
MALILLLLSTPFNHPMQISIKKYRSYCIAVVVTATACSKQNNIPITEPPVPVITQLSFTQDSIPLTFAITEARKENVGNLFTTAIEGKYPDSTIRKNNIIIRLTGDSARAYANTEILVSYTDSAGITFSNQTADTVNKAVITKMEKKKNGIVEGSFTIRVSNTPKTKMYLLKNGRFTAIFESY